MSGHSLSPTSQKPPQEQRSQPTSLSRVVPVIVGPPLRGMQAHSGQVRKPRWIPRGRTPVRTDGAPRDATAEAAEIRRPGTRRGRRRETPWPQWRPRIARGTPPVRPRSFPFVESVSPRRRSAQGVAASSAEKAHPVWPHRALAAFSGRGAAARTHRQNATPLISLYAFRLHSFCSTFHDRASRRWGNFGKFLQDAVPPHPCFPAEAWVG